MECGRAALQPGELDEPDENGGRESYTQDPTLQHPRCVFQVLKRHFARYTPEMVEQVCGVPRICFSSPRPSAGLGTRAHRRHLLRRRLDAAFDRLRRSSARRRSCSSCSATSAGPAAGFWRCAATRRSRDRPISRRSTTCFPATCRCRDFEADAHSLAELHRQERRRTGWWANFGQVHRLPAEGVVRRRRDRGQRLRLRLAAAHHRRPLALRLLARHGGRQGSKGCS